LNPVGAKSLLRSVAPIGVATDQQLPLNRPLTADKVVLAADMNALRKHSPVLRVPSIDERLDADAAKRNRMAGLA
jgi:hypothetical protein